MRTFVSTADNATGDLFNAAKAYIQGQSGPPEGTVEVTITYELDGTSHEIHAAVARGLFDDPASFLEHVGAHLGRAAYPSAYSPVVCDLCGVGYPDHYSIRHS